MDDATLTRLADLAVGFGCNLQEGQILAINGEPGKERMVRAVAESAYKHGAKFVDVGWFDPWVKRARIQYAAEDTLDFVPPWLGERVLALGEHRAARVALSGPVGGGFYLRAFPSPLLEWGIARLHREGLPAVLYVHPPEFDREKPRLPLPLRERILHYHGLGTVEPKLARLLARHRFVPICELLGL